MTESRWSQKGYYETIKPQKVRISIANQMLEKQIEGDEEAIIFDPYIEATGSLKDSFGHKTLNCSNQNDPDFLKSDRKLYKLLF